MPTVHSWRCIGLTPLLLLVLAWPSVSYGIPTLTTLSYEEFPLAGDDRHEVHFKWVFEWNDEVYLEEPPVLESESPVGQDKWFAFATLELFSLSVLTRHLDGPHDAADTPPDDPVDVDPGDFGFLSISLDKALEIGEFKKLATNIVVHHTDGDVEHSDIYKLFGSDLGVLGERTKFTVTGRHLCKPVPARELALDAAPALETICQIPEPDGFALAALGGAALFAAAGFSARRRAPGMPVSILV